MATESYYVLEKAGFEEPVRIFNKTRVNTIRTNEKKRISASYQSYYIGMSAADIQALRELYAFDIYVLQYPDTPFVDFAKS